MVPTGVHAQASSNRAALRDLARDPLVIKQTRICSNRGSRTGHRSANDPYFLYAASNLGSLIGLLLNMFLVELTLPRSGRSVLRLVDRLYRLCSDGDRLRDRVRAASREAGKEEAAIPEASKTEPEAPISQEIEVEGGSDSTPDPKGPGHVAPPDEVARAGFPSVQPPARRDFLHHDGPRSGPTLVGHTSDSLYLVSFVVVFGRRHNVEGTNLMMPLLILSFLLLLFLQLNQPIFAMVMLVLLLFFAGAVVCHGRLAADRPSTDKLTEYFLFLAIGGALGASST